VDDAADEVKDGKMPPRRYELAHPDARLTAAETAELVAALRAMEQAGDGGRRRGRD
jgi:hypothetical protein